MAAYRILELFDVNNLAVVIFDDADIVVTSYLVNDHLLKQLPDQCQVIMTSSTFTERSLQHLKNDTFVSVGNSLTEIPEHVQQFAFHCENEAAKLQTLHQICKVVREENSLAVVFCNVSLFFALKIRIINFTVYFDLLQKRTTASQVAEQLIASG